ncbi:protein kinase domain-containing protein [Vulgatibacter incomptus]|uniref:Serine/threonine protein kinase n=1 Tax=Vulgatibacter incomptus TaxID=1391653 RepID=A0A0K1PEG7_9BACT|nr:protein kinase [Vulgatibacter incomptus]AKU91905.1 Serine/threonine protein kinase [Vulgatibacter incomptus]
MGSYQIIRRLAVGGMAEVFLGKRVGTGGFEKPVAIKRLLPALAADPKSAEAFLREARICVQLVHSNVVQVLDLGTAANHPYLVMELVDGEDLRRVLNAAATLDLPLGPPEAIHIAALVADALAYAWDAVGPDGTPLRLVHRDVNPSNVLLSMKGEVKLADFGVAKAADGRDVTQGNLLKGKVGYLAPELLHGVTASHASDVFLNGVLLFEILAGRPLFGSARDAGSTLARIAHHDEKTLELPPGAPAELKPILRRTLARDPAARYPHASELSHALHGVLQAKGWRVGREAMARRMGRLFPDRVPLDRDLGPGFPLESAPGAGQPSRSARPPEEAQLRAGGRKRIGELMIDARLITEAQLQTLLARQRQEGGRLGEWAATLDFAPVRSVLQLLAGQLGVSYITDERLLEAVPPPELLARFPQNLALRLLALPVAERDGATFVAMADPADLGKLDLIRFRLGGRVTPIVCTEFGVRRAIARAYGGRADELKWRQLDASDPLSLLTTRVIDFEAQEREHHGHEPSQATRPRAQAGAQPPGVLPPGVLPQGLQPQGVFPGAAQPPAVFPAGAQPPGVFPPGAPPPGYVLAYVPAGLHAEGQPLFLAWQAGAQPQADAPPAPNPAAPDEDLEEE